MGNLSPPRWPMMHHQQSLMLRWRSFSWWGMEGIVISFAYKGSQKFLDDWIHPVGGVISQDAWPAIVDSPLMLIFMIGHGGYCNLFCLWRQPEIPLWLNTPYRRCHLPGRMNKNRWRSVDAHLHDGACRVLQSVWPIKGAKNSFMTEYTLWEVSFPNTHDQKLLTICWHSFSRWGREGIAICFAYKGSNKFL